MSSADSKISPAFEEFMAQCGPNDKRDAIVVYHAPLKDEPRVRGRLRTLKKRLDLVRARAAAQQPVAEKLIAAYRKEGGKHLPAKKQLDSTPIGEGTLPVAKVEVTKRTLPSLAAQPQVIAVLPNQKIHLIKPKEVDYSELAMQEERTGLTWGLKQLDIPKLWKTTKGEGSV